MSEYTWRELERADMDTAAAYAADMEYRAEQIASEVQKRLAKMEHIVNGLGEVKGEIIRCRGCANFHNAFCVSLWEPVDDDGFCAWGKRRDTVNHNTCSERGE